MDESNRVPQMFFSTDEGLVWRAVSVRHLTGAENAGKHNVFVTCLIDGRIVRDGSVQVRWGWEGQRPDEPSPSKLCDKQGETYSTDIPINDEMKIWCEAVGRGAKTDRVSNLSADLPPDGPGNDWKHNSWAVIFELKLIKTPLAPPVTLLTLEERVAELERWRASMEGKG